MVSDTKIEAYVAKAGMLAAKQTAYAAAAPAIRTLVRGHDGSAVRVDLETMVAARRGLDAARQDVANARAALVEDARRKEQRSWVR